MAGFVVILPVVDSDVVKVPVTSVKNRLPDLLGGSRAQTISYDEAFPFEVHVTRERVRKYRSNAWASMLFSNIDKDPLALSEFLGGNVVLTAPNRQPLDWVIASRICEWITEGCP